MFYILPLCNTKQGINSFVLEISNICNLERIFIPSRSRDSRAVSKMPSKNIKHKYGGYLFSNKTGRNLNSKIKAVTMGGVKGVKNACYKNERFLVILRGVSRTLLPANWVFNPLFAKSLRICHKVPFEKLRVVLLPLSCSSKTELIFSGFSCIFFCSFKQKMKIMIFNVNLENRINVCQILVLVLSLKSCFLEKEAATMKNSSI